MIKCFRYGAALVAFFGATFAVATDWSEEVKVTEVVAGYKDGFILFRTSGTYLNPNNCSGVMYSVDPESANVEHALSILIAAQRSGSEIAVGIDPTSCGRAGVQHLFDKIKVTRIRAL